MSGLLTSSKERYILVSVRGLFLCSARSFCDHHLDMIAIVVMLSHRSWEPFALARSALIAATRSSVVNVTRCSTGFL